MLLVAGATYRVATVTAIESSLFATVVRLVVMAGIAIASQDQHFTSKIKRGSAVDGYHLGHTMS